MKSTRITASQFVAMLMVFLLSAPAWAGGTRLTTVEVASGFSNSLYAGSPPGDSQRLFVVEQAGVIKIIRLANGEVVKQPFIDISDLVRGIGDQGLLGLAFHPDYGDNRFFYVTYTDFVGTSVAARYRTLAQDPDRADPDSAKIILTENQRSASHNCGMIAFGPNDGYLYIGFGDDGQRDLAQSPGSWLGTILRVDVDVDPDPYIVPPTNPFVGDPDTLDEIWALGLRNPWRWSFDRDTGDMYIGDVGAITREEINYQPAASGGGENYGWDCMEGSVCTGSKDCICNSPTLTLPIRDYDRNDGRCVIGGHVYRGQTIRDLRGTYFFADYVSGRIWSLRMVNGNVTQFENRTGDINSDGVMNAFDIEGFIDLLFN